VKSPKKAARDLVFGWMNVLLGTLSSVVPPVQALAEIKESFEQAAKDRDDELALSEEREREERERRPEPPREFEL